MAEELTKFIEEHKDDKDFEKQLLDRFPGRSEDEIMHEIRMMMFDSSLDGLLKQAEETQRKERIEKIKEEAKIYIDALLESKELIQPVMDMIIDIVVERVLEKIKK